MQITVSVSLYGWIGFYQNMLLIVYSHADESSPVKLETSGQPYKASTIINYDSRVVPDLKIPHIMNLDS